MASLVLGILWLAGLGSLLAFIFGLVARRQIGSSQGHQSGEGLATAGITLGALGVLGTATLVGLALWIPYGSELTVAGQPVKFEVTNFTDPAKDANGYNTDYQGDHYATVTLAATNDGDSAISASLPVTVVAYDSAGSSYEEQYGVCPNDGGQDYLQPGETLYYCAGFTLPGTDTISTIEVSPEAGYGEGSETFTVTDQFTGWLTTTS